MIEVITGGASVGQGFETVIAQVCAEMLGVDYRKVRVVHGRTDRIEYGIGAHATRATVMTANATAVAAVKVRAKALNMAAQLLQAGRVQTYNFKWQCCSRRRRWRVILASAISRISYDPLHLRAAIVSWPGRGRLVHDRPHDLSLRRADCARENRPGHRRHSYRKNADRVRCRTAINPALVRGQLVGGFAQGLGGALFEEFQYDDRGQPLSVTLADYLIPTANEVPEVDILLAEDAPSKCNPLGIKGAGEGGVAAVGAVIASAVDDALGGKGLISRIPITPQTIKAIIDNVEM